MRMNPLVCLFIEFEALAHVQPQFTLVIILPRAIETIVEHLLARERAGDDHADVHRRVLHQSKNTSVSLHPRARHPARHATRRHAHATRPARSARAIPRATSRRARRRHALTNPQRSIARAHPRPPRPSRASNASRTHRHERLVKRVKHPARVLVRACVASRVRLCGCSSARTWRVPFASCHHRQPTSSFTRARDATTRLRRCRYGCRKKPRAWRARWWRR